MKLGSMRLWVCLALVWAPLGAARCEARALSEMEGGRLDFRTVIVRPAEERGWVRVTVFYGFRVGRRRGGERCLIVPVEGIPQGVRAQAMSVRGFDWSYTHGADLEGAFYGRAVAEGEALRCLFAMIAANGGAPAWFLLAPRWPPKGRGVTAVVEVGEGRGAAVHGVRGVEVVPLRRMVSRFSGRAGTRMARAARKYGTAQAVVVWVRPSVSRGEEMRRAADAGIRVDFEAPLSTGSGEGQRFRLLSDGWGEPAALTRIYVVTERARRTAWEWGEAPRRVGPAQRLVRDALSAFGSSGRFRKARARRVRGWNVCSVIRGDGGSTMRVTGAFADFGEECVVRFRAAGGGGLRVTRVAAGRLVLWALWPATVIAYLAGIWAAFPAYFWMTGFRRPDVLWRSYLAVAALGPFATPWYMLRLLAPRGELPAEGPAEGPFGVLSARSYECVVRLVIWALLVCVNWVVVSYAGWLGLWLRYG